MIEATLGDFWVENFPEDGSDFFAGGDFAFQLGDFVIQMAMVEAGHHFALEDILQFGEIEDHSCAGIRFAGDGDFENVVVPVAVRIIAFAEDALILGGREFRIVIKMSGGKFDFAG